MMKNKVNSAVGARKATIVGIVFRVEMWGAGEESNLPSRPSAPVEY